MVTQNGGGSSSSIHHLRLFLDGCLWSYRCSTVTTADSVSRMYHRRRPSIPAFLYGGDTGGRTGSTSRCGRENRFTQQ